MLWGFCNVRSGCLNFIVLAVLGAAGTCFGVVTESIAETSQEIIVLTVDKSRNQAVLATLPEDIKASRVLRTFQIATGKVEGDKERQGDNKTPEGIYFTTGTIPSQQLAPEKYGPLAIPLNFPNPMDQVHGKTGYGIWLHGVGDRRIEDARVTEGCVAFQNTEITGLENWLKPNHGVVVIAKTASEVNRAEDQNDAMRMAAGWIEAWAKRDIDRYISYYSPEFQNAGKDRKAYEAYKRAVFASYKNMDVKMTSLRVVTHSKYAMAMMNQDFTGDNRFKSEGRKMLYMRKNESGQWQIVRELFDNFLMRPVRFSASDIASLNKEKPIAMPAAVPQPEVRSASSGSKSL